MAATSEQAEHSIQMLISDWLLIDGTMDNHVHSAIDGAVPVGWEEGPSWDTEAEMETTKLPTVAQLGTSIRQAGWDQILGWPHDAEGFRRWPAPGQMATMTLTNVQWDLVIFALNYWADVDVRLSDAEGAARSRAIATVIGQLLAEQRWSPESQ
ncbi:hypothetical protein OG777_26165 [Micromonospora peucetia]|uniref:Uncharacterized protein n=1 Tax=Micromonospora peucetia TaxID=47871 RepID=A0A1C6W435_9ACTN|nr:hypothetical protein [Micromonospora peucetia]MCX4390384.1 hypothetical protein [Micromonospora peucetia]SCL73174.1 hypothetical protein GA0070608_5423 [Micromonospora peucetia]